MTCFISKSSEPNKGKKSDMKRPEETGTLIERESMMITNTVMMMIAETTKIKGKNTKETLQRNSEGTREKPNRDSMRR